MRACQIVATTSLRSSASLALRLQARVHIRRCAPDVDDKDVGGQLGGEDLDAGEHRVGVAARTSRHEPGAPAQPLAADDMPEEDLADRRARWLGWMTPIWGSTLSVTVTGTFRRRAPTGLRLAARALPARTTGMPEPGPGERSGVVEQDGGIAAIGAADEQDDVGPAGRQRGELAPW